MGNSTQTVGGGAAKKPAADFANMLDQILQGGNVTAALGRLLGGDTSAGINAIRDMQNQSKTEDLGTLTAAGGLNTSSRSGTTQAAKSLYLARRAPQDVMQIEDFMDKRQLAALGLLLPAFGQALGLGTPQAQTIQKPSFGKGLLDTATGLATSVASIAPVFSKGGPAAPSDVAGTGPNGWGGSAQYFDPNNPWG
jgi:hypothetical protein